MMAGIAAAILVTSAWSCRLPSRTTKWHVPLLSAVGCRGQSSHAGGFFVWAAMVSTLFKFLWGFLSLNSKMTKTSFGDSAYLLALVCQGQVSNIRKSSLF